MRRPAGLHADAQAQLLNALHDAAALLDANDKVELANPAFRELLGSPVSPLLGSGMRELVPSAELAGILDRSHVQPGTSGGELELPGPVSRRVRVRVTPLLDGPEGRRLLVLEDVTELRRLEHLRRDFVANASHELRTPVASIRAAAEMLGTALERDPDAARRFVQILERNSERLHNLIADLLDLSRLDAHQHRLAHEAVDVSAAMVSVHTSMRPRADTRQQRLVLQGPTGALRALGDQQATEQILTNLVDNALRYCAEGATVVMSAAGTADGHVALEVSDNGPGIEARHLPRLFERFYRVDKGRSREAGGTGLGLSIVKHLVEAMEGEVEVRSEVGKGTAFLVRLTQASRAAE